MGTIFLKHIYPNELPDQKFYFYEGECGVHYGVIELPQDPAFEHWAKRAWLKGFRLDPETGVEISMDELLAMLAGESAKSAEDAGEGTDAGRQPAGKDRVRSSKSPRDDSLPEEGLGSGDGDGAAVQGEGD